MTNVSSRSGPASRLNPALLTALLGTLLILVGAPEPAVAQVPPIVPTAASPQQSGSTFWVEIKVGSDSDPVSGLFGTSFVLDYEESRLSVAKDEAGSFLGSDVVYSSNNNASVGEIGIGVTRKSGAGGVDGSGVVARVKVRVEGEVPDGTALTFVLREVEATDSSGTAISLAPKELVVQVGSAAPAAPTGLTATAGDGQVKLSWSAGEDSSPAGYNIYRSRASFSDVSSATKVNGALVSAPSYTDTGLANGTEYFYRVTAVDSSGTESGPSGQVSATPMATGGTPPITPTSKTPRPPGETFWVRVKVGSGKVPVESLFGTSFVLKYDASRLSVVGDEAGPFLGSDVVYTSNDDSQAGEIGIGVTRKSGAGGVGGTGVVARVKFKAESGISDGTSVDFRLDEVEATDSKGNALSLAPQSHAVRITSVPPLRPEVTSPQTPGKTFWVDVKAGSKAYSIEDLFGVSFVLEYDKTRLSVAGDEAGPLLGSNVVYTANNDPSAGKIGIGVTRKSGAGGVDGSGVVARVKFRAAGGAPEGTPLAFSVKEVEAKDPSGASIKLRPGKAEATLQSPAVAQSAQVRGDGPISFGPAGVTIGFAGTTGSGTAEVRKYGDRPARPINVNEENLSSYRFVIETGPGLKVGKGTEVRFDASRLSGLSEPEKVTVYKRPKTGKGPFKELPTAYDSGSGELVVKTDGFSEFVFASNTNPLPVELSSFSGTVNEKKVRLTWKTASETNNAGFDVQHQPPGSKEWRTLGFVESKASGGTTTEPTSYRFTAENLSVGTHRFRLRQVDLDGATSLSEPVTVELHMEKALRLSPPLPNPARTSARLRFGVRRPADATVRLYNVLGQRVATLYAGTPPAGEMQTLRVGTQTLGQLPSGVYFVRLTAGGKTRTRRLTIAR